MLQQLVKSSAVGRLQNSICASPSPLFACAPRHHVASFATASYRGGGEPSTSSPGGQVQLPSSRPLSGCTGPASTSGAPRRLVSSVSGNRPVSASYLENELGTKGPGSSIDGVPRVRIAVDVDEGACLLLNCLQFGQVTANLFSPVCFNFYSLGPHCVHAQPILQGQVCYGLQRI